MGWDGTTENVIMEPPETGSGKLLDTVDRNGWHREPDTADIEPLETSCRGTLCVNGACNGCELPTMFRPCTMVDVADWPELILGNKEPLETGWCGVLDTGNAEPSDVGCCGASLADEVETQVTDW